MPCDPLEVLCEGGALPVSDRLRLVEEGVDEFPGCLVGFGGAGGVDVEGHGWAGVAEASGDGSDVGAVGDQVCSGGMAEVVIMPTSA